VNSGRVYLGAATVAITGILFFVLVMPSYDGISARRVALDERNQMITDQTAIVAKLNDLRQQAATRAGEIKQFSYVVPATKNAADLVSMLQALANQNGLQLTNMSMGTGGSTDKSPYVVQSIDLGLSGGYIAFRSFIDSIEKNIRIIDIDSIDAAPTTDNSPIIGFRVKAHAYFLQ
jgi:Tfp pilus assembly protein PilO